MRFFFKVQDGRLVKIDMETGLSVAVRSPIETRVVEIAAVGERLIVREDAAGHPPDRSNLYALNHDFEPLWTAQPSALGDPYVALLRVREEGVYAASREGRVCVLDAASGRVVETIRSPQSCSDSGFDPSCPMKSWKGFFSLTGGSILYCLSAMFLLYGFFALLGPILARSHALAETLPCIGVLNVYELALLGVLLLIVLWKNVTDDAISLVVLIALFLIANGSALDTVATEAPEAVLYLGVGAMVLAVGKLYVLRRFIIPHLSGLYLGGLAIILLWNFLCGPLLAQVNRGVATSDTVPPGPWQAAWMAVLAAGVLFLIQALRTPDPQRDRTDPLPFLRTAAMPALFALVVLTASGLHQLGLAHAINFSHRFLDFVPVLALAALLLVEVLRVAGVRSRIWTVAIAAAPLAITLYAIWGRPVASAAPWLEVLWHPPVILTATGAGVLALYLAHPRRGLLHVAVAYGLAVLLTWGATGFGDPARLNWTQVGVVLVTLLLVLGIWRRNPELCFGGAVVAAFGLGFWDGLQHMALAWGLTVPGAVLGVAGLATLAIYVIFGDRFSRNLAALGALAFMVFVLDLFPQQVAWADLAVVVMVGVVGTPLWMRTRDYVPIVLLCLPLALRLWAVGVAMGPWRYVAISFALLAAGTWLSLRKAASEAPAALPEVQK
ncbi:MAG: hypothetical protein GXY33_20690 [Phycisphaerae bacterium]|nr:hypothetical protein [Phycisphaerae bacterium]